MFNKMLKMQKRYNDVVLGENINPLLFEKITQDLALCAHAEISSLVNATNFKKHHGSLEKIDRDTILFESVDVIRYVMAILNVWNVSSEDFEKAFQKKDDYLWIQQAVSTKKWSGQPVAIIDIDDVLAEFRSSFASWLSERYSIEIDVESEEYYFITALSNLDCNPELVFEDFIKEAGFAKLPAVQNARNFLINLKEKGYWIQLLTARPSDNLRCFYDTFSWIKDMDLVFDRVDFSSEKFRWCAKSEYYDHDAIQFAIDDSPKHATEYANHGIKCYVPRKSYNKHLINDSIRFYDNFNQLLEML